MRFSYLFVVTFGRSGSTLLQAMLNAMPRTLIRGENNNFLYGQFKSWESLGYQSIQASHEVYDLAWEGYEFYSRAHFEQQLRSLLDTYLLGGRDRLQIDCLGFKEIRYLDMADRGAYLEFLLSVFPNSALILHSREPAEAARSGWWKDQDSSGVMQAMSSFIAFAEAFSAKHPDRTLLTSYEKIIGRDRSDVRRLFDFCGCKLDMRAAEAVMAKEYSTGNNRSYD